MLLNGWLLSGSLTRRATCAPLRWRNSSRVLPVKMPSAARRALPLSSLSRLASLSLRCAGSTSCLGATPLFVSRCELPSHWVTHARCALVSTFTVRVLFALSLIRLTRPRHSSAGAKCSSLSFSPTNTLLVSPTVSSFSSTFARTIAAAAVPPLLLLITQLLCGCPLIASSRYLRICGSFPPPPHPPLLAGAGTLITVDLHIVPVLHHLADEFGFGRDRLLPHTSIRSGALAQLCHASDDVRMLVGGWRSLSGMNTYQRSSLRHAELISDDLRNLSICPISETQLMYNTGP